LAIWPGLFGVLQGFHLPMEADKLGGILVVQLTIDALLNLVIFLVIVLIVNDVVLGPLGLFSLIGLIAV
jgi:hypothetical protein